jgi:hypothetical protein
MPSNLVTFPTHAGDIRIEFSGAGPLADWQGPAVFFSLNHTPVLSVVMRDGEAVIDVLGLDSGVFEQLPQDLQDAARWWQAMLKLMDGAWSGYVRASVALAEPEREAA